MSEIKALKELIGLRDLRLHTLNMSIVWGKYVLAPNFSIHSNDNWIIIESAIGRPSNSDLALNHIVVYEANAPKDTDYLGTADGHRVLNRFVSDIDFIRPYQVESIEIYQFVETALKGAERSLEFMGCIVFRFLDNRCFALSSINAPAGMLEFIMESTEIDELIMNSNSKTIITKE